MSQCTKELILYVLRIVLGSSQSMTVFAIRVCNTHRSLGLGSMSPSPLDCWILCLHCLYHTQQDDVALWKT